ncbi:MAG: methyltransferase [Archaeoglobi archaeon]|nr:methyltransferase [Archaeoglobi archaeon]
MRDRKTFLRRFTRDCQNVYEPAEDSELLLECALKEVRKSDSVLEVGTGSGFVSYFLQERCSFLLATDINPHAARCARSFGIECVVTDLARGIRRRFDLILFNPPYLRLEDWERRGDWLEKAIDGGKDGVEVTVRFLEEIADNLSENGRIIIISSSTTFDPLKDYLSRSKYEWEIVGKKKLFFEELYALKLRLKL